MIAACTADRSPIEGVWQSDRTATLEVLEAHGGFDDRQWELFRDPEFFGNMVQVYRGPRGFVIFEGECSPWFQLAIEDRGAGNVTLHYIDEPDQEEVRLTVAGDRLRIPIQSLGTGVHEVFARASADEIARMHPCLRARLAEREL